MHLSFFVFLLRLVPFAALLACNCVVAMSAQDEDFFNLSLEELGKIQISAATGNSQALDRAPATASVVTAAEIQVMGARTLNDVLESIPGVHISLSDINRLDSIISIRGIHTGFNPHVLLLMNGVPVKYSAQGGRPLLFRLPVTSISRVEVIRGPGSAIYGADAFSGVINVITRDPAEAQGFGFGGRVGSFEGRDFWVSGATKLKDWNMSLDLSYLSSEGDPDRIVSADFQTLLDGMLMSSASLAPGPLSTRYDVFDIHAAISKDRWDINLWSWLSLDSGNGAGGAQVLDPEGRDNSRLYMADIDYEIDDWIENWELNTKVSYLQYTLEADLNLFPAGAVVPINSDGNLDFSSTDSRFIAFPDGVRGKPEGTAEDLQFDFVSIYTGLKNHRWRIAVGGSYKSIDSSESKNFGPGILDGSEDVVDGNLTDVSNSEFVYLEDRSRSVRFASLQDEWQFAKNWELTAGIRYDSFSDFGNTTNPRAALVWLSHEKLTTKLLYGSAFRAPSFTELFFINNPVSIGNPEVQPEKIDTLELSFNYRMTKNSQFNLSLFRYEAKDMIEYVRQDGESESRAQNSRDQKGSGVELEFNWRPTSSFRLSSHISLQNSTDVDSGDKIADAPRRQFFVSSYWEFSKGFFVEASYKRIADRPRRVGDLRASVADYGLLDVTFRAKNIINNFDLALFVRNATNEDAREPSGGIISDDYLLEYKSVWLELSRSFN